MPHKHKRRRTDEGSSFDLPPTSIAKPLPAFHQTPRDDEPKRRTGKSRPNESGRKPRKVNDDTPRAFARLLNFQKTGKGLTHTLDDGTIKKGKQRKLEGDKTTNPASKTKEAATSTSETATANAPVIKILPGERLADFSARVDQALPVVGLKTKGQAKIPGVKTEERKTKHNRRLERMQKEWREEETRRKEKPEEVLEDEVEQTEKQELLWQGIRSEGTRKKRKGGKSATDKGDDDPWAELEVKRRDTKQKHLQDVVQAPPQLKGVKSRVKDKRLVRIDVTNVPGSAGSLRKREDLGGLRRNVIEEYRKIMGVRNQVIEV